MPPKSGFTLLEMLIVLAIFGMVMTAASTMFTTGYNAYQRASRSNSLIHYQNLLKDEISTSLRASAFTTTGGVGAVPTFANCDLGGSRCDSVTITSQGRTTVIAFNAATNEVNACFSGSCTPVPWIGLNLKPAVVVNDFYVRCFSNENAPAACTAAAVWRYEIYMDSQVNIPDTNQWVRHIMVQSVVPPGVLLQAGRFGF